jgi:hypothetical protein
MIYHKSVRGLRDDENFFEDMPCPFQIAQTTSYILIAYQFASASRVGK